jgi:hypothetical protein
MKIIRKLEKEHNDLVLMFKNGFLYVNSFGTVSITHKNSCDINYIKDFEDVYIFENLEELTRWLNFEFIFPTVIVPLKPIAHIAFKYLFIYHNIDLLAVI